MDVWRPYTIETLHMSKVASAHHGSFLKSVSNNNAIMISVTPYLTGGQGASEKVWIGEKALLRRLTIAPPQGYRRGEIFTRQKGEEYEIVFQQK